VLALRYGLELPPGPRWIEGVGPAAERVLADSTAPPPDDRWIARDKVQHVTFSFLWTLSTQYVLVTEARWSETRALPFSIASGAAIGLAKEIYDWQIGPTRYFSNKDLVADALGILLATGLILL
jgi:uncharacterized protein YfiM (DUF2279 family)